MDIGFFGEQPYTSAALGIKKIDFFGAVKIPAYGTFPHPNVLAGFLVISLMLILSYTIRDRALRRIKLTSLISLISLILGVIALFLTFSIPSWIVCLVFLLFSLKKLWDKKLVFLTIFLFLLIAFLTVSLKGSIFSRSSLSKRLELNRIALKMWQSSPIFGAGLNNFVVRIEEFGRVKANYRFLQPVHNIFLLVLAETGLVGLTGLISLIGLITKKLGKERNYCLLFTVYCLLFLGLFDHYWLTIQQGMLVMALVIGLAYAASAAAGKAARRANA